MATKEKIIYYQDEHTDDFADNHTIRKPSGEHSTYEYIKYIKSE